MKDQRQIIVNGKTYPLNLKLLLKDKGKINYYEIKEVYFLKLTHGLMGFFPAIIYSTKRMIITENKELLQKVWEKLSPRRSEMDEDFFYVSEDGLVGYPAKHWGGDEEATAYPLMKEEEFNLLTTKENEPFQWAPGLVGDDMSPQEFLETIQTASEKINS